MTPLHKFTLEFSVKTSPKLLFTLISTTEGLARWFADRVKAKDNVFFFEWEGSSQSARLTDAREPEYVRFEWLDDFHEGFFMEMQIEYQPVSGEVALIVSDYSEASDMEFSQMWWTTQIARLQRLFNSN